MKKHIKTIEYQGEKQIKAFEEHGKQLVESNALVKRNDYDTMDKLLLKENKIYVKTDAERKD